MKQKLKNLNNQKNRNKLVNGKNISFYCYYTFDNYDPTNIESLTCLVEDYKVDIRQIRATFKPNYPVFLYYYPNEDLDKFVTFFRKF